MSNLIPFSKVGQIEFFESHLALWTTNAVVIGLTAPQMTAFTALVEAARDAYSAAEDARIASKNATMDMDAAIEIMHQLGTGYIQTIRGKADSTLDPSVYSKAGIPAPATPTPSGTPNQPTALSAYIDDGGGVNLSWNGSTRYSTYFTIWRKLPGESGFTIIGTVGGKKWLDSTVEAGTTYATYYVKAHRGNKVSVASMQSNVIFGIEAMAA